MLARFVTRFQPSLRNLFLAFPFDWAKKEGRKIEGEMFWRARIMRPDVLSIMYSGVKRILHRFVIV